MALCHLISTFPSCTSCIDEQRRISNIRLLVSLSRVSSCMVSLSRGKRRRRRGAMVVVGARGRLNVSELQTKVESQSRSWVEIPVTCYQIIGVLDQAEKDEIVKSVMNLKNTDVEEGYTLDAAVSRQELLMDVRDKLLFEPEYAGNRKEKVPPKSPLRIPWSWLPGALCILQEVGEEKMVLEIGRAALQHSNAKSYIHDFLLSMALAECATAKIGFEKNKVSQGFEALARAQYLLRSKDSLGNMPLLSQIEESLEELAPACTLELLGGLHTPENVERRRGAMAALRELLRQGLDVETSCQVKDWQCFLIQALNKLTATEIVDLLPWDNLAVTRKNKKSLESQNQWVIIDSNCFYTAMIAHIALGFTSKQAEQINKAKAICECLVASEGIDLKFEEAFCSFLLGQGEEVVAAERLRELEISSGPTSRNFVISEKEINNVSGGNPSLEIWLKDAVLGLFPDTRNCSPNLANFFQSEKRSLRASKQSKGAPRPFLNAHRSSSFVLPSNHSSPEEPLSRLNSTGNLGVAVKQLAAAHLESPLANCPTPSIQLKRNLGMRHKNVWESFWFPFDIVGRISLATVVGCFVLITFRWHLTKPKVDISSLDWTMDMDHKVRTGNGLGPAFIGGRSIGGQLGKLLLMFKRLKLPPAERTIPNILPGEVLDKKPMPVEEAEALVKQWQTIKAEALGPDHQLQSLSEVLSESMLTQWEALAHSAKNKSCFWRFVLLQLSVLRADIMVDGSGGEMAEIEALLEEAAELVDESQHKNPNYYSTYKIRYILKRKCDGSWRFCRWDIQNSV